MIWNACHLSLNIISDIFHDLTNLCGHLIISCSSFPQYLQLMMSSWHHGTLFYSRAELNLTFAVSCATVFACQATWNGGCQSSGPVRPTQTFRVDPALIFSSPLSVCNQGKHLELLEKKGQLNANKTSKTSQNIKFLNPCLYHDHPFYRHVVYFRYVFFKMELKEEKMFSHGIVLFLLLLLWL